MKLLIVSVIEAIIPTFVKNLFLNFNKEKPRKIAELKNHDIFNALSRVKNEAATIQFHTHGEFDAAKTRMCYDFVKHKTYHCGSRMKDLIAIKNIDTMNRDALKSIIFEEQRQMHVDYIKAIRKEWESKNLKDKEINYVVHLFEKFRSDVIMSFEYRINSIFGSSYNKNNFTIMLAIFEMWAMGIDLLPRDIKTTFHSINGTFKDIKYIG